MILELADIRIQPGRQADFDAAIQRGVETVISQAKGARGWKVPPNITILAMPPKSPELNPVENVWQFMRDNWLSNRVFTSYDDLVDHCCVAWNKLVNQPWRIMSIGLRQWAHRF